MSIGEERYGIACRECGEISSKVIDSRESNGRIRRRRQCPNGHRVSTVEYVAADLDEVMRAADVLKAAADALLKAMLRSSPVIDRRATRWRDEAA